MRRWYCTTCHRRIEYPLDKKCPYCHSFKIVKLPYNHRELNNYINLGECNI
jgi:hypothetical protein